ncbi:MAG: YkvA family protein [Deferribacterales bacterium]
MEDKAMEKAYSEESMWKKLKEFAIKAGGSVVYAVLLLYYTMKLKEIPLKIKAVIMGALGYFILPLDVIPDAIPGAGFTDDLGVLVAAIVTVATYIDEEVRNTAKDKLKDWFGEDSVGEHIASIDEKLS